MSGGIDTDLALAILTKTGEAVKARHPVEVFFGTVISAEPLTVRTEEGLELTRRMLVPIRRRHRILVGGHVMRSPLHKHDHPEGVGVSPDMEYDITIDWSFKKGQRLVIQRVQGNANLFLILGEVDDTVVTGD